MANVTLKNIKKIYDKNVVAVQEFKAQSHFLCDAGFRS